MTKTQNSVTSESKQGCELEQHNPNNSHAQRQRLLSYLRKHKKISTLDARRLLDVLHPAARIMELRIEGFEIQTHWSEEYTTANKKHRVAEYVLFADKLEVA